MDLRVLIPAAAAWAATIGMLEIPELLGPVAVGCWVAAAGCLAVCWRATVAASRVRAALVLGAVAFAATGLIATSASIGWTVRRPAALAGVHSVEPAEFQTTQTAVPGSSFFAATLTRVGKRSVSVPVLVFRAAPRRRLEIGTTLRLSGSLIATESSDEVSYLVFAHGGATVVRPPPDYLGWANGLRAHLADAAASLPGDGGELLPGLAIGDTTAVDPALNTAMKTSSLSHLTAVSGANCAVVIALVLLVGRALGLGRGIRFGVALLVLAGFVVLVTPQPSVLRSAVMAAIAIAVSAAGRPVNGLAVVGVASMVLLVSDPWLAVSYGFALSALATAGLMIFTSPLTRRLELLLPRWLSLVIAVPLAAQLACQPVLVLLSPSLPPYGVLANLLAEPASPIATVTGLIACVALPVLPALGQLLAAIAWVPAAWIAAVATFFAGLPGARLAWPGGVVGAAMLAIVTVVLLAAALGRMRRNIRILTGAGGAALLLGMLVLAAVLPGVGGTAPT